MQICRYPAHIVKSSKRLCSRGARFGFRFYERLIRYRGDKARQVEMLRKQGGEAL